MKKLLTLIFAVLAFSNANAQLQDGSIAPDFILTDLNGNTWHLYELLDQGKSVVLDFSATWCGPCWGYHQSGALENLYEQYGPTGTGEFMVFMIEGDPSTNIDCIYDMPGCNSSTQGNWADGTPYPIINDDNIAFEYEINYWPTIYHICPNRIVTESPQESTASLYARHSMCATAIGTNNAALLEYQGFSGSFCGTKTFTPSVKFQNLGLSPMTSATLEFWLNSNLMQTVNWTGTLNTFGIESVGFDELTVSADAQIEIKVTSVNGTTDDDPSNNQINKSATLAIETDQNLLTLELRTDAYPRETYWEVKTSDNAVFYSGGNALVAGGNSSAGAYTGANTVYTIQIPLPGDGCYEFAIFDAYGDGICCTEGDGYFRLKDANDNIIVEGGAFEKEDHQPFSIANAASPINDNGSITAYTGESGDFCGTLDYHPSITIQNLGSSDITSVVVEVSSDGNVIGTTNWTGNIPSAQTGDIVLDPISIDASFDLEIAIKSINGSADNFDYQNTYPVSLTRNYTDQNEMSLALQLDSYAYEIYWQLTNSAGDVLYSGGNQLVGPNGGGLRVAGPSDPGAYAADDFVLADFVLPDDVNDCYEFLLVDDYGDGLVDGGGGFFQLIDNNEIDIVYKDLTSTPFTSTVSRIDVHPVSTGVTELKSVDNIRLFPNPTTGAINVAFNLTEAMPLQTSVYNMLGELVMEVSEKEYTAGSNHIKLDVSQMGNAVYYLRMANGNQQLTRKFTVIH